MTDELTTTRCRCGWALPAVNATRIMTLAADAGSIVSAPAAVAVEFVVRCPECGCSFEKTQELGLSDAYRVPRTKGIARA